MKTEHNNQWPKKQTRKKHKIPTSLLLKEEIRSQKEKTPTFVCTCMHAHAHTHTHTHTHTHIHTHTHTRAYTCTHTHAYTCTHTHAYTCTHTHAHVRVLHTHTHTHTYAVHTYTVHIHTFSCLCVCLDFVWCTCWMCSGGTKSTEAESAKYWVKMAHCNGIWEHARGEIMLFSVRHKKTTCKSLATLTVTEQAKKLLSWWKWVLVILVAGRQFTFVLWVSWSWHAGRSLFFFLPPDHGQSGIF